MSISPPIRRLSNTGSINRGDLINQYEAEEERIINVLSRKLEQLREDKIDLENALEAESESQVNKLSREISMLRQAQQQQGQLNGHAAGSAVDTRPLLQPLLDSRSPLYPSAEVMLDAMRRENEHLRNRLVDTERDYIRIARLNEIYREELIEHRRRLGLPVDNLIGLSHSNEPFSQPLHLRSHSASSSPSTSGRALPSPQALRPTAGVPIPGAPVTIPRPPSQIHRPVNNRSETTTPGSHSPGSPASPGSPYAFSPALTSPLPASYTSAATNLTTPPSSASLVSNPPGPYTVGAARTLSYPSVPPPSLSSSFGSPTTSYHFANNHHRADSGAASPEAFAGSRMGTFGRRGSERGRSDGARVAETGSLVTLSRSRSRRASLELGASMVQDPGLRREGREGPSLASMLEVLGAFDDGEDTSEPPADGTKESL